MNIEGCTDLSLELQRGSRVSVTITFKNPRQAEIAFEQMQKQSRRGELKLILSTGAVIPER